jgi:hypothetical protein
MGIEKITTKLKNKTWNDPQIENHKKSHKLQLIRLQTEHTKAKNS